MQQESLLAEAPKEKKKKNIKTLGGFMVVFASLSAEKKCLNSHCSSHIPLTQDRNNETDLLEDKYSQRMSSTRSALLAKVIVVCHSKAQSRREKAKEGRLTVSLTQSCLRLCEVIYIRIILEMPTKMLMCFLCLYLYL